MTYYNLISNLKILEKNKRNEEAYNNFINSDITLYTDMNYRLGIRLINFINEKVDSAYKDFITKISKGGIDANNFQVQTIDLRNDLLYIKSFTNIKYILPKLNEDFNQIYDDLINEYNSMISSLLHDVYGETYSSKYDELLKKVENKK